MKYITKALKDKGVKQKDLIKDLNCSQAFASALMNGKKKIGKDLAYKLNKLYELDEASLLLDKDFENLNVDYSTSEKDGEEVLALRKRILELETDKMNMQKIIDLLESKLLEYESKSKRDAS